MDAARRGGSGLEVPTRRTVLLDTVVGLAAYGAGLGVATILAAGDREGFSLSFGVVVFLVAYAVMSYAITGRQPELLSRRPWRYSLPNALGLLGAVAVSWLQLDGPTTFAVAVLLLIGGGAASQLWWALAAERNLRGATA